MKTMYLTFWLFRDLCINAVMAKSWCKFKIFFDVLQNVFELQSPEDKRLSRLLCYDCFDFLSSLITFKLFRRVLYFFRLQMLFVFLYCLNASFRFLIRLFM